MRQVSPSASSLNHRQRFALQQSFISQACAMHKDTPVWEMRKVLKGCVLEWYRRRALCAPPGMGCAPVREQDMTFLLSAYQQIQQDVNPHWWLAACVE